MRASATISIAAATAAGMDGDMAVAVVSETYPTYICTMCDVRYMNADVRANAGRQKKFRMA